MKKLIGVVLVLLMSASVVAGDVAITNTSSGLPSAPMVSWVVIDDEIFFCYSSALPDLQNGATTPECWEAKKSYQISK